MARRTKRVKKQEEPEGDAKGDVVKLVEHHVEPAGPVEPGEVVALVATVENRAQVVKKLLAAVEEKMKTDAGKTTMGDYIRLVQLHKELDEEEPKEIRVTWVEPETKE
jgi:hypothetical protein